MSIGICNVLIRENSTNEAARLSIRRYVFLLTDPYWGKSGLSYSQASLHDTSYVQILASAGLREWSSIAMIVPCMFRTLGPNAWVCYSILGCTGIIFLRS